MITDYCTNFSDLAQRAWYKDGERASIALFERHLCKEATDQQAKDRRDEEGKGEFNSLTKEIEVVLRLIKFVPATYMEQLRAEINNEMSNKTTNINNNKVGNNHNNHTNGKQFEQRDKMDKTGESRRLANDERKTIYYRNEQLIRTRRIPEQRYEFGRKRELQRQQQQDAHARSL